MSCCKPPKTSLGHDVESPSLYPRAKSLSPEPVSQSLHFTNEFMMGMNKNGHKHTQVSPPSARSEVPSLQADGSGGNPWEITVSGPFLAGS